MPSKTTAERKKGKDSVPAAVPPAIEVKPIPKALRITVHLSAIGVALFAGLFVRFHYLSDYQQRPENSYNGTPILSTADAYYFTKYAREQVLNEYHSNEPDRDRDAPDSVLPYPKPIPMISYMAAKISRITGADIDHVAFYMPPILAVLCVIPIYLIGVELSGVLVGFTGAVLGVTFQLYLVRSCLGRFDTDCLNLFFLFMIPYCCLKAWQAIDRRAAFIWAAGGGIALLLFNWWYEHPAFALPSLLVFAALLFWPNQWFRRPFTTCSWPVWIGRQIKEAGSLRRKGIMLGLFALLSNPLQLLGTISGLTNFFWNHLFPAPDPYGFPNILISVSESMHYPLYKTLGTIQYPESLGITIGIIGLVGLAWLVIKAGRRFIPVWPAFALGLLAITGGNRLTMYLAPFLGMGVGFMAQRIQVYFLDRFVKPTILRYALLVVLAGVCLVSTVSAYSYWFMPEPRFPASTYRGIAALKTLSHTGNAWTWWDWGYAIEDIGQKATYTDGGSYRKAYFVGRSLATTQPAECRNTMLGVTNLGFEGLFKKMKELKLENPEPILNDMSQGKYNKTPDRPLYLVFTDDMPGKYYWIHRFGTWNFTTHDGQQIDGPMVPFPIRSWQGPQVLCAGAAADLDKGFMLVAGPNGQPNQIPLKQIYIVSADKPTPQMKDYGVPQGYIGIINVGPTGGYFYAVRPDLLNMVFVQMYLLKNYDKNLFEMVFEDFPYTVIYKVK